MDGSVIKRMILTEGKTDFIMKPRFQRQIPGKKTGIHLYKSQNPGRIKGKDDICQTGRNRKKTGGKRKI